MTRRPRTLLLACLAGLLIAAPLIGAVVVLRARVLDQTATALYTPLSGTADWDGDWEFSDLGADPGEAGTDRVTIPFAGTDFALRVRRGNYRGYLFISIDGEPANDLPLSERGAYLVLTSPDLTPQVVTLPIASRLEDGPHVAEVIADRGWDQWPLAGWSVSRRPDTSLYDWALVALVSLAFICLLGIVVYAAGGLGLQASDGGPDADSGRFLVPPGLWPALTQSPRASGSILLAMLASAGLFYFSPYRPLAVASGLALAVLVLLRLDLGLALVAGLAPFYLQPRPVADKLFSMVEIVVLLCALSWGVRVIARWYAQRRAKREAEPEGPHGVSAALRSWISRLSPTSSLDLAVLTFVLVAIASYFVAEYRHVALRELRVVILEPALFYLMLRTTRLDAKAVWRIVDLFVLGAAAVATIGLAQYAMGVNIITAEGGFRRLRSVYGSPNNVGLYLGRALPVLVAVCLLGRARRRRVAYGIAALPVAAAILFSFSRGALLVGVPLSLLAVGILAGGRWLVAALGAALAAALAAIPFLRTPRFASLFDVHSGTTFFRLQLWRSSWAMFLDHLWLGVGPDNFLYSYRGRYIRPAAWQELHLSHAHNVVLDYATRMGIPGLAVGVWLQIAFWRLALPLRRLNHPDRRALALGLMGMMVSFLAHGMVDASYFLVDLAFALGLSLGVIQLLARSEKNEH